MAAIKMKVIDIDNLVLKQYVEGCKYTIKEEKKSGTFIEGHNRGIDDALRLVDNENDLTSVMRIAVLGSRHQYDKSNDQFYTASDVSIYAAGYDKGMDKTIRILTGK